jgi:uncharacterized membrane protein (DUF2068 family)
MSQQHASLRYIAVYKFIKAAGLLFVALVAFRFVQTPFLDNAAEWIRHQPIAIGHAVILRWVDDLLNLQPHNFEMIGVAASVYGALFLTEGIGLWRGLRWAEYLTVFATASLIPFEAWEIFHRFGWIKVLALILNVAIVIYLWRLVRRER